MRFTSTAGWLSILYLRCPGVIGFGLCGFLSVSVVVLGFCSGGFCVGFVWVVCLYVEAWGVVVVVLVEVGVRRRLAVLCCTTFYKLDLRFT